MTLRYPSFAHSQARSRGFSLMEVVIAVAVFAGSIVAILGLLGPSLQTTREVIDSDVAARLAAGITLELEHVGFDFVERNTTPPAPGEPDDGPLTLFATVDGSRVAEQNQTGDRAIDPRDRYFQIAIELLLEPESTNAFRALHVRVEWPHMLPDGLNGARRADDIERKWYSYNTAIRR